MDRIVAILLVSWSLVLAPALCLAGVLKHDCDGLCPETSHENAHRDAESSCGHEAECQTDPCSNLVTPGRGSASEECTPVGTAMPCEIPALSSVSVVLPILAGELPGSSYHLSGRPFVDRGLPLLI